MAATPDDLRIRMYNVGFGDCFLLTFRYGGKKPFARHVLVDFGSTAAPEDRKSTMDAVAALIKKDSDERLDAVIATHRHADHISGFATRADGMGSGDVIRSIAGNALVIQPWTEDPDLPTDAQAPLSAARAASRALNALHVKSLEAMGDVARSIVHRAGVLEQEATEGDADEETQTAPRGQAFIPELGVGKELTKRLAFLGETNLKNSSAVKNLQSMSPRREFLSYGAKTGLAGDVLPGVKVHVLGPPTIRQHEQMLKQRPKDAAEYWHLQAMATRITPELTVEKLFPNEPAVQADMLPKPARWFVRGLKAIQADQMHELVRIVDSTLNNTSLILLLEVGGKLLLFPGDAQIENWEYALKFAKNAEANVELLSRTEVYKVGHHGSLNATPKSLWQHFGNKPKLITLMSTRHGKHGKTTSQTEVPRTTLVKMLKAESDLHSTVNLKGKGEASLCDEVVIAFRNAKKPKPAPPPPAIAPELQ